MPTLRGIELAAAFPPESQRACPWVARVPMSPLEKLAKDAPAIKRIYFLRLHGTRGIPYGPDGQSGECGPQRSDSVPFCQRNDTSLIGQDDDDAIEYQYSVPGAGGRSRPNERRLAFCLLEQRASKAFQINNPERQKSCPD